MSLPFTLSSAMTLGVEAELQILDPELDLAPRAPRLLEALRDVGAYLKPELFQAATGQYRYPGRRAAGARQSCASPFCSPPARTLWRRHGLHGCEVSRR